MSQLYLPIRLVILGRQGDRRRAVARCLPPFLPQTAVEGYH